MTHTIVANDAMQRWVADAAAYPRAIPARLRGLLDAGLTSHEGGSFFAADFRTDLELPIEALERFTNTVRLDTLKPVQRLKPGTELWTYECVAIGIALGDAVLALDPAVTVVISIDVGDVEYPDATFRFGTARYALPETDDPDTAILVMTS
jgi:hypothetical protein